MSKVSLLFILILLPGLLMLSTVNAQVASPEPNFLSSKYQGTYSYARDGGLRVIAVYPETDTTMLFYIDIFARDSNKRGSVYGRVFMNNDTGTFATERTGAGSGCTWEFNFGRDSLCISTVAGYNDCGLGAEASADGIYKKHSDGMLNYFSKGGKKVYYDETKPEDFNKRISLKFKTIPGISSGSLN